MSDFNKASSIFLLTRRLHLTAFPGHDALKIPAFLFFAFSPFVFTSVRAFFARPSDAGFSSAFDQSFTGTGEPEEKT